MLYREFTKGNKVTLQLVVPEGFHKKVMRLAHETLMSGHLGTKKILDRVVAEFFWPGILVRLMTSISKGKNTPIVLKDKLSLTSKLISYAIFFRLSSLPKRVASYCKKGR